MKGEEVKFLMGKIHAVELLCATLSAILKPEAATLLLQRIAALKAESAAKGQIGDYEKGFCSLEETILESRAWVEAGRTSGKDPGHTGN